MRSWRRFFSSWISHSKALTSCTETVRRMAFTHWRSAVDLVILFTNKKRVMNMNNTNRVWLMATRAGCQKWKPTAEFLKRSSCVYCREQGHNGGGGSEMKMDGGVEGWRASQCRPITPLRHPAPVRYRKWQHVCSQRTTGNYIKMRGCRVQGRNENFSIHFATWIIDFHPCRLIILFMFKAFWFTLSFKGRVFFK